MRTYTKNSPYGAWVSKNEIIPVIYCMEHESVGAKILQEILGVQLEKKTRSISIYSIMYRLGYVRVVYNYNHTVDSVAYWKNAKLSNLQRGLVQDALYKDVRLLYSHEYKKECVL